MKALLNWRYYVLLALCSVAVVGVCGVPADDSEAWLWEMALSKAAGFGAAYAAYRLAARWARSGRLPEMGGLASEED